MFIILLGAIVTVTYFLITNNCEPKSIYKDSDIQYAKHYLSEKQAQLVNLGLAL